jgi:hypothetical protein
MVAALLGVGYLRVTRIYLDLVPFIATGCVLTAAPDVTVISRLETLRSGGGGAPPEICASARGSVAAERIRD